MKNHSFYIFAVLKNISVSLAFFLIMNGLNEIGDHSIIGMDTMIFVSIMIAIFSYLSDLSIYRSK